MAHDMGLQISVLHFKLKSYEIVHLMCVDQMLNSELEPSLLNRLRWWQLSLDFSKDELDIIQSSSFRRKKTDSQSILNTGYINTLLLPITKMHIIYTRINCIKFYIC